MSISIRALGQFTSYDDGDEDMVRKLEAVYEGGVLKPVETLRLDEYQLVNVIFLVTLGHHVEIVVKPRKRGPAELRVA